MDVSYSSESVYVGPIHPMWVIGLWSVTYLGVEGCRRLFLCIHIIALFNSLRSALPLLSTQLHISHTNNLTVIFWLLPETLGKMSSASDISQKDEANSMEKGSNVSHSSDHMDGPSLPTWRLVILNIRSGPGKPLHLFPSATEGTNVSPVSASVSSSPSLTPPTSQPPSTPSA
jgi:hypothetical protein